MRNEDEIISLFDKMSISEVLEFQKQNPQFLSKSGVDEYIEGRRNASQSYDEKIEKNDFIYLDEQKSIDDNKIPNKLPRPRKKNPKKIAANTGSQKYLFNHDSKGASSIEKLSYVDFEDNTIYELIGKGDIGGQQRNISYIETKDEFNEGEFDDLSNILK